MTLGFPGPINIRSIVPADALAWESMRRHLWPDGADDHAPEISRFFAGTLQELSAVLVAETLDGDFVGFSELAIRLNVAGLEGVQTGYIEGIYVIPEARAQGVALALLQASRSWARHQRCTAFASDRVDRLVVDRRFRNSLTATNDPTSTKN
jgi:aminoglycoside 6'-N-acetyltransferase I